VGANLLRHHQIPAEPVGQLVWAHRALATTANAVPILRDLRREPANFRLAGRWGPVAGGPAAEDPAAEDPEAGRTDLETDRADRRRIRTPPRAASRMYDAPASST
jgi:hypothetical protein